MKGWKLALALLACLLVACGGGGGGPTRPKGRALLIDVALGSLSGGVIRTTLLFDGEELSRRDWSVLRGGCAAGCQLIGSTNARPGTHRVEARIDEQSRDVVTYFVFGQVLIDPFTPEQESIGLPRRDVSLRAGESISYTITF